MANDNSGLKNKTIIIVFILIIIAGGAGVFIFLSYGKEFKARRLMNSQKYLQAKEIFESLDSTKYYQEIEECENLHYEKLFKEKKYEEAKNFLLSVIGASTTSDRCKACDYQIAEKLFKEKKYGEAIEIYRRLGGYKKSKERYKECKYQLAEVKFEEGDLEGAKTDYSELAGYKDSDEKLKEVMNLIDYESAVKNISDGNYKLAVDQFIKLRDFKDSPKYVEDYKEKAAEELFQKNDYKGCVEYCKKYFIYIDCYYESNYLYGMILFKQGNKELSIDYLKEAMETHPEVADLVAEAETEKKYKTAIHNAKSGNLTKAIEGFDELSGYMDSYSWQSKCYEALRYTGDFKCYSFRIYDSDGSVSDLPPDGKYGNFGTLRISASLDNNMNITYTANGRKAEPGTLMVYYQKYGKDDTTIDIAGKSVETLNYNSDGSISSRYVSLYE